MPRGQVRQSGAHRARMENGTGVVAVASGQMDVQEMGQVLLPGAPQSSPSLDPMGPARPQFPSCPVKPTFPE